MESNLKKIRLAADLSLKDLGDMCGKSKQTIHLLEKETGSPILATAYTIAKILGCEVTDIWPNNIEIVEKTIIVRRVKV